MCFCTTCSTVYHVLFQLMLILIKTDKKHCKAFLKLFKSLFVFLGLSDKDQGFVFKLWSDVPGFLNLKLKYHRRNILCKLFGLPFLK